MESNEGFPILETARLRLRKPQKNDAQWLLAVTQDENVMRYYGMEAFPSEQEALHAINDFNDQYKEAGGIRWIITIKPQDDYVGDIGFGYIRRHARADLGFKLAQEYWRQGIVTEAMDAVIAYGIEAMEVNRFEAVADPRNVACVGLLEQYGFRKEGLLREYEFEKGAFVDLLMYSLLSREWNAKSL
jgi:ribosomal-protein-alanine N-acetyltransferase